MRLVVAAAEAAVRHGKFAGTVGSPANLADLVALGYRFVSLGADVVGLSTYCHGILAEVQKRSAGETAGVYGAGKRGL